MSVNGKWAAESYSENTSKSPFDFHVNRRQEPRAKAEGTKAQPENGEALRSQRGPGNWLPEVPNLTCRLNLLPGVQIRSFDPSKSSPTYSLFDPNQSSKTHTFASAPNIAYCQVVTAH